MSVYRLRHDFKLLTKYHTHLDHRLSFRRRSSYGSIVVLLPFHDLESSTEISRYSITSDSSSLLYRLLIAFSDPWVIEVFESFGSSEGLKSSRPSSNSNSVFISSVNSMSSSHQSSTVHILIAILAHSVNIFYSAALELASSLATLRLSTWDCTSLYHYHLCDDIECDLSAVDFASERVIKLILPSLGVSFY